MLKNLNVLIGFNLWLISLISFLNHVWIILKFLVCFKFSKKFHVFCCGGFVIDFFEFFLHDILNVWQKRFYVTLRQSFCADFWQNFDDWMSAAEEFPLRVQECVMRDDNRLNHALWFDRQVKRTLFERQQSFCVSKNAWKNWNRFRMKMKLTWTAARSLGENYNFRLWKKSKKNFQFRSKFNLNQLFYLFLVDGFWLVVHGISCWFLIMSVYEQSSPQITSKSEGEQVENFFLCHLRCSSYDRP